MADQNIQIGADASSAVSELGKFEASMLAQSEVIEKFLGRTLKYNTAGALMEQTIKALTKDGQTLTLQYQSVDGVLTKTAESLTRAASAMGKLDTATKKSKNTQKDFAAAQAAVTAGLGRQFSTLPEDSTGIAIEAFEREKNRLARLLAGSKIKGGAQAAVSEALAQSLGGVFSEDNNLFGKIQRQVFNVVEAYKRVGASSPTVLAANRQSEVPVITAETKALQEKAAAQLELIDIQRRADAALFRQVIDDRLGTRSTRQSRPQFAASQKSFNTIRQQFEDGNLTLNRADQLLESVLQKKDAVLASNTEKQAFSAFQQLSNQVEDYNRKLAKTIQLRAQAQAARSIRQGSGAAQANADARTGNLRLALQAFGLNQSTLSSTQNAAYAKSLATVNAAIRDQSVSAQRASEIFDTLANKKDLVFKAPKEIGVVNAFNTLLKLVEDVNKVVPAKATPFDRVAQATLASRLQQQTIDQLGGIKPDASQAQLAKIQSASNALGRFVQTSRISEAQFNAVMKAFLNDARVTFTGVEGQALKSMRGVAQALKTTQSPFELFGLTWTNLTKLFAVQVIHSAISRVIGGIEQASNRAAEFSIKISEIRTLTEGNAISTGVWATELRKVSDAFGIDLLDTAAAAYDILSNQVAKGTNAIAFLTEAAVFSKVTVSSLQDSVNLLSAAVNAYRNQGLSARRASEILFSTIDLGKVRVQEIADTFGNVAILGAQVGVSFEELNAIFAGITIQGTRADTAMTLLNNIMLKLLKPTGEIRKLMDEWGVSTGKQAFATFGALGVLQKFNKAIEEGKIALEDANETRAIRGFAATTSDAGLDIVQENIRKQREAAENLERAAKIAQESPGAQFKKQLVEFSNVLTQDVGARIFETFVQITQAMGGIKNILTTLTTGLRGPLDIVRTLSSAVGGLLNIVKSIPGGSTAASLVGGGISATLGGILTGFLAMKAGSLLAAAAASRLAVNLRTTIQLATEQAGVIPKVKAAFDLLTNSMGAAGGATTVFRASFGGIAIALAAVVGVLTVMSARAEEARAELLRLNKVNLDSLNQKLFEFQSKGFENFFEKEKKALQERNQTILQQNAALTSELKKSVTELTENQRRQQALLQDVGYEAKVTLDFLVNGKSDDAETELKEIVKGIQKSIDATITLEQSLNKLRFNQALTGLDPFAQSDLVFQRIEQIKGSIATLFDERNMDGVRNAFKEINDLIKQQLIGPEGLDTLISKTKEQLELLGTKRSPQLARKTAQAAEERGLRLLDVGNIKAANEEFAKADKLFDQLQSKAASSDKALAKLGVKVTPKTGQDETRLKNRLAALESAKANSNPEDLLTQFAEKELQVEKLFQQVQAKNLVDNAKKLEIINASNKGIESQTDALQGQQIALAKNLETHNQTLTVITAQIEAIQKLGTSLSGEASSIFNSIGTEGGSNRSSFVRDNDVKLTELQKLLTTIEKSRTEINSLGLAFKQDQNPATLKSLNDATAKLNEDMAKAIKTALELKIVFQGLALKGFDPTGDGLPVRESFPRARPKTKAELDELRRKRDAAVEAANPDLNIINRDGSNIEDSFRQLKDLLPVFQKENEELQKLQNSINFPPPAGGFWIDRVKEAMKELGAEIQKVLEDQRTLKNELNASPNLKPTQLGQAKFSSGISNVQPIAPVTQPQSNQVTTGDIVVNVQEVVDGKIDPVELGNALRRAIRQGLIPNLGVSS